MIGVKKREPEQKSLCEEEGRLEGENSLSNSPYSNWEQDKIYDTCWLTKNIVSYFT